MLLSLFISLFFPLLSRLVYRIEGVSELYDLVADPRELNNLWENTSYTYLRSVMLDNLLRFTIDTSDITPSREDDRNSPPSPIPPFPWPTNVTL